MANEELQRTDEWHQERLGHLTASNVKNVLEFTSKGIKPLLTLKGEEKTQRITEKLNIIAERLTGEPRDCFVNRAMEWGTNHEDEAIKMYEIATGNSVDDVGFIRSTQIEGLGASPDGLVGNDGQIEVKCPDTTTHLKRLMADVVPDDIKPQMCCQLLCTGRKWVDFIDYDPRIKDPRLQLFVKRYEPTKEELQEVESLCKDFLTEVKTEVLNLTK